MATAPALECSRESALVTIRRVVLGVPLMGSEVLVRECQFALDALVVGSDVEAGSVPDLLLTFGF